MRVEVLQEKAPKGGQGAPRPHRAGLEKGNAKAHSAEIGGRLPGHTEQARVRELEEVKSDDRSVLVRRGSGDGMGAKEWCRNTGSSCVRQVLQKGKWYAPKCREVVRATPRIGLCSWSEVSVRTTAR